VRGPALALVVALALPPFGAAAGETPPAVLEIHNDLGEPVQELYVLPAGSGAWTNRLESGAPLPAGMWAELALDPAKGCLYDIGAATASSERRAYRVDLCGSDGLYLSATRRVNGFTYGGPAFAPPGRGLPFCPGDPRCKRKK